MPTPNMGLTIPIPGVTTGPTYATQVDDALTVIDGHTHDPGSGVPITPVGMNISSDLSFNSNNAIDLRSSRYINNPTPLPGIAPDLGCVYMSGGNLYFNDGSGNQVLITSGGSLAGAAGTITGLPSGTASASYSSIAQSFIFRSATNTAANVDGRNFIFRNSSASSFGLTVSPPAAMGADTTLTLPTNPAQTNVVTLSPTGTMASVTFDQVGVNMTAIGANAVANTRTRVVAGTPGIGGVAVSSGTGTFDSFPAATTYTAVPGTSVTLTSTGRPIAIVLIPDPSFPAGNSAIFLQNGGGSPLNAQFAFRSGGSNIINPSGIGISNSGATQLFIPPSTINGVFFPPAGTYLIELIFKYTGAITGFQEIVIVNCKLVAYEL